MNNDGIKIGGPGGLGNVGKGVTPPNITSKNVEETTTPNVFGTGETVEVSKEIVKKPEIEKVAETSIEQTLTVAQHNQRNKVPAFISLEEVRIGDNLLAKGVTKVGFGPNNMPADAKNLYTGLMNTP